MGPRYLHSRSVRFGFNGVHINPDNDGGMMVDPVCFNVGTGEKVRIERNFPGSPADQEGGVFIDYRLKIHNSRLSLSE
jgi:hypothetical protein